MWRLDNGHGWLDSAENYPWVYNAGTQSWWYFPEGADGSSLYYNKALGEWGWGLIPEFPWLAAHFP